MTRRVSLQSIGINKASPQTPHVLRWEVFEGERTFKFTCSCSDRPVLEAFAASSPKHWREECVSIPPTVECRPASLARKPAPGAAKAAPRADG